MTPTELDAKAEALAGPHDSAMCAMGGSGCAPFCRWPDRLALIRATLGEMQEEIEKLKALLLKAIRALLAPDSTQEAKPPASLAGLAPDFTDGMESAEYIKSRWAGRAQSILDDPEAWRAGVEAPLQGIHTKHADALRTIAAAVCSLGSMRKDGKP